MVNKTYSLIMGDDKDPLVVISKDGNFLFINKENYFLNKENIHSLILSNSEEFLNYLEASERLKYMNKYFEQKKMP